MVDSHSASHAGLNLHFLGVHLPLNLVAGLEFLFGVNAHPLEHCHGFRFCKLFKHFRHRLFSVQSAAGGLFVPLIAVAVAVEADNVDNRSNDWFQGVHNGHVLRFSCGDCFVHICLKLNKLVGHDGVQNGHCVGAVGARTHGAELEAVASEGERRRTVAVGVVNENFRNLNQTNRLTFLASNLNRRI